MAEQRSPIRYEFKSNATGRLVLMGPSGEHLLRVIGKEPSDTGMIAPASLPTAIAAIATAIEQEDAQRLRSAANGALVTDGHDASRGDGVTLRQRAWPLVEMMKQALRDDEAIVWGVDRQRLSVG